MRSQIIDSFLNGFSISDLVTEAKKFGCDVAIIAAMDPAVSEARDAYLAGTMPAARMMTLVGEMATDRQLDVCSLQLPELPLSFDELVMDRAKLRKVSRSHSTIIV